MALGAGTFSAAGGAVSDLFAGFAASDQASLKAAGLNIQAQGIRQGAESTRIQAQGTRLTAQGLRIKASGDLAEASNYDLASGLARENERYTEASTNIREQQLARQVTQTIGGQRADVAGSGLAASGSALSILSDSAAQGALARHTLIQQGQITEAGYEEQAKSYDTMAATGRATAAGEFGIAGQTDTLADRADKIAGGQEDIANRTDVLAQWTREAGDKAQTGDFISGAIKGVGAVGSLMGDTGLFGSISAGVSSLFGGSAAAGTAAEVVGAALIL